MIFKEEMQKNPIIIHISGSPGSGKTTLGERIHAFCGDAIVAVKDTDDFIQRGDAEHLRLKRYESDQNVFQRELRELKTRKIDEFIESNKEKPLIVFVGLMDHFGLRPFYDFTCANHKFFLKISPADLLRQYYTRLVDVSRELPVIWDDIVSHRDYVESSEEKMTSDESLWLQEHSLHGYQHRTADEIMAFIEALC